MIKKIYLLIFIVLSFMISLSSSLQFTINSDAASMFREAIDISKGNILLRGWTLSTVPFYFTDTIWYATAISIFGNNQILMWVIPSIFYTGILTLSAILIFGRNDNYIGILALVLCMILPSKMAAGLTIAMCIHAATIFFALASLKLVISNKKVSLLIFFLISSLCVFSDSIYNYILVLPLALSLIGMLFIEFNRSHLIKLLIVCSVLIAGKLISFLSIKYGLLVTPGTEIPRIVAYDKIPGNLDLFFRGILEYFDSNIFGKELSLATIPYLLRFLSLILWGVLFIVASKKLFNTNLLNNYLIAATIIMFCAYLFSNMPVDLETTRYLVSPLITGSILIGRFLPEVRINKSFIIIFFIVLFINNWKPLSFSIPTGNTAQTAAFLQKEGLGDGYGTFWVASSVSVVGDSEVAPISIDERGISKMNWLSSNDWYGRRSRYIIVSDIENINRVLDFFGKDAKVKNINGIYVIYYDDERIII